VVCERFAWSSFGCGWLWRAALWLVCERWYIGTAVPKGGVGGMLGVAEQLDIGAAASVVGSSDCWLLYLRSSVPCYSFHSSHGVFSTAVVKGHLVLLEW
jgi:hypothetical protein